MTIPGLTFSRVVTSLVARVSWHTLCTQCVDRPARRTHAPLPVSGSFATVEKTMLSKRAPPLSVSQSSTGPRRERSRCSSRAAVPRTRSSLLCSPVAGRFIPSRPHVPPARFFSPVRSRLGPLSSPYALPRRAANSVDLSLEVCAPVYTSASCLCVCVCVQFSFRFFFSYTTNCSMHPRLNDFLLPRRVPSTSNAREM